MIRTWYIVICWFRDLYNLNPVFNRILVCPGEYTIMRNGVYDATLHEMPDGTWRITHCVFNDNGVRDIWDSADNAYKTWTFNAVRPWAF